jgi:hypothetical protein
MAERAAHLVERVLPPDVRVTLAGFSWLRLQALDVSHHAAVLTKLERLRGCKLSYVDAFECSPSSHGIRLVWGTDRDLGIEGARVVPVGG